MATSRDELTAQLDELERQLPDLVKDYPGEAEFWPEFAGRADVIEDSAGAGADARYVSERIDRMLVRYGKQTSRAELGKDDDSDDDAPPR